MVFLESCKTCKGSGLEKMGIIFCPNCNGKGCIKCWGNLYIQKEYEECRNCWGSGTIKDNLLKNYIVVENNVKKK
jgi:DnaJ-class molecular chaperone